MIDKTQKLPSGYRLGEVMVRAEKWWGEYRGVLRRSFNLEEVGRKVAPASGKGPGIVISGDIVQTIPDGILSGLPWPELTEQEQMIVTAQYHRHQVLEPAELRALNFPIGEA